MTAAPKRRKTPYVSMNVTLETRDALQGMTFRLQAETGQRIPMSKVLLAALTVADAHLDELRTNLSDDNPTESNGETQ